METKIIGNKIAEARKEKNISQAQLAQLLFISSQAVGKWERGESMPDIITFSRLAEILGVDLNYFSESTKPGIPGPGSNRIAPVESMVPQPDAMPSGDQDLQSAEAGKKRSWNMSEGSWVDADFSGLKNLHDKFSSSNLKRCLFVGADMSGLLMKSNNVDGCDFSGSELSRSHFQNSNVTNNLFKECSLNETVFTGSHVRGCDFSSADFTAAVVKTSDFGKNTITAAVWNRTSFIASQLSNIVFEGVLEDCSFENCAFSRVTFQGCTLINTFFKNKSLRRIRFVDCKADRMTYAFLKNGKADLSGITLLTQE